MNIKTIEKEILYLENQLLKSETRESEQKLNEIIDDELIEFSSNGKIYHYKKGDTFISPKINWEIIDFSIKQLSDFIVLATYKLIKHSEINLEQKYSIRSSVWKYKDDKWKMIFHQGTLTKNS